MNITERRTVETYVCDGACEGCTEVLVPHTIPTKTFHIEPSRYRVTFWWTSPKPLIGCRIEVLGRRIRKDGSVGQKPEQRRWDLTAGIRDESLPDWLRLVVDVDLYDRLPEWGKLLWNPNSHLVRT